MPIEQDIERLPIRVELEKWWQSRSASLRDGDGLEVLRAMVPFQSAYGYSAYNYWVAFGRRGMEQSDPAWLRDALKALYSDFNSTGLRNGSIVHTLLTWLLEMHPPASGSAPEFLLRAVETTLAAVPQSQWASSEDAGNTNPWERQGWRTDGRLMRWLQLAIARRKQHRAEWSAEHHVRLWKALHWLDQPAPRVGRLRPDFYVTLAAYRARGATEADILDQLLGTRPIQRWGHSFSELQRLSGRKPVHERAAYPFLSELIERCRKRIIEVEVGRGDMPTAASTPALALRYSGGLDTLVILLRALGKESFVRGWTYDSLSRASIFSHLVRSTFPTEEDTRERFASEVKAARIPEKRLVEVAMYAPQWAAHVEAAVGWSQLAEAVWWIHAHTKDAGWSVDQEIRESWAAQVSERTPLSSQSLLDGAVDVAWFGRVYSALGQKRWEELYDAAKYAAGGGGYKRAQLFADAMLGRVEKSALVKQVTSKRQQDALRALGLLPRAGGKGREEDILDRYKVIQEFLRTRRKFGSQRQASEKLAASVAMENLARTAGYPDPVRLEWAMEAKAVEDLANGPLTVAVDEVTLSLSVNDWGEPELAITKQGKALKAIPPKVKKDPSVAALREREKDVRRQASRMRTSLENAMCRGDEFTAAELEDLLSHPVLAPMIEKLVFTGDPAAGYPVKGSASGVALRSHDGDLHPVGKDEGLRIAHPYDLLSTAEWHLWQHDLFLSERVQPFKQVFRELYVLTAAERGEDATGGTMSRRYEGHQVNPRQALALLGSRGWVSAPEEGVRRTFHDVDLSAFVTFLEGFYTPADVDGLTVEGVQFTKRGDWKPLPLSDIPQRVFSEVMRDLDLVVSVAHRGGVDPEASASTVEMRSSLVRETCDLLEIGNVRLQGAHALIDGKIGNYSVHLGSGVVHRQPGGSICIVPVHSQHRGRLFLPFADDDPKTAEVLSKVLPLAQDAKIQDPTILEQLLAVG